MKTKDIYIRINKELQKGNKNAEEIVQMATDIQML